MTNEALSAEDGARQAGELLDRRRVFQARQLLSLALQAHPDHPELLFEAARADAIEDKNESARATLADVLRQDPQHFNARVLLMFLLMDDNDLVEAERLALSLLHEYPQSAYLYAAYARVMLRALYIGKARALANEALRLDPDSEDALRARALCDVIELPRGTDSAALSRLIAHNPEDQHTLALMVAALSHEGKDREALRGARELLRAQPDNPHWLALVRNLSVQTHWTMLPLAPLQRFGWSGAIGLWIGSIVLVQVLARTAPSVAGPASLFIFGYCVYSWVWPPILRRWLLR
jgi:tetratricopeptide (TPR) repeat protein